MAEGYNGWSNYETWLINLWYGDYFGDLAGEGEEIDEDRIESTVLEFLEMDGHLPETGFAADIMNAALRKVNWRELASHYEVVSEDDDDVSPDGLVNEE